MSKGIPNHSDFRKRPRRRHSDEEMRPLVRDFMASSNRERFAKDHGISMTVIRRFARKFGYTFTPEEVAKHRLRAARARFEKPNGKQPITASLANDVKKALNFSAPVVTETIADPAQPLRNELGKLRAEIESLNSRIGEIEMENTVLKLNLQWAAHHGYDPLSIINGKETRR